MEEENTRLAQKNDACQSELERAQSALSANRKAMEQIAKDTAASGQKCAELQSKYAQLNEQYEFLLESNNALMGSTQAENQKLVQKLNALQTELSAKEDSLVSETERLDFLSQELQKREARVYELESLIAEQKKKVEEVRSKLKEALFSFDGQGLTVEQRDGKVYVSLENSLLFPSGSWTLEPRGRQAVSQVAEVLAQNPDLNVTVEGHTDSDAFNGSTAVKDNWDLSVMRATSIVKVLTANAGVKPEKITAAGRSEYIPIATNETAEGKAENRRTEIIITPNLDAVRKVLE